MATEHSSEEIAPNSTLWRNYDFLKLWVGQTISMFGSQITTLAVPLLAAETLQASAGQMAALHALQFTPALLVGLFAGAWVDRLRRRPILIGSDLGRGLILLAVPIAAALGWLRLELLYMVALCIGMLNVFFDAADNAFLPSLVAREHLIESNSRLAASSSVARIAGPGLAGVLVQVLTAPVAIALDGLSFLLSALAIGLIRTRETAPPSTNEQRDIWSEIGEGMRTVYGHAVLRAFLLSSVTLDVFWNALFAVYFLLVTRELNLPATAIGLIFGIGSVGTLIGATLANRLARWWGVGPTIIVAQIVIGIGGLLIAGAVWLPWAALPLLIAAEFIQSGVNTIYGILRAGLTQAVTPNRLLGRVWGSVSFVGLGIVPVAALLGGVLGEQIGVPATVVIGGCGGMLAFPWLLFSPIRQLRTMPAPQTNEQ